ncbi:MAG: carboxylesterase/lipase family protein [Dehalococcoidales bacterium]|nr:carboxylesterase/lipase family protein [Dehalococcoidales bacterium]
MIPENISVQTTSGRIKGTYENGLYIFKGVPYATPPVGDCRWMPPQPVQPWSGVRSAENFGPICPQSNMPTPIPGRKPSEEPQGENCLFLNVWTPGIDNSKRAVMVWIHGGAFTHGSGSSPMNPGSTLPERGGVVLVSINYRLGVLGFLRLIDVTNGRIPSTGNEALLDQIAALRWVKENISNFGGDPDNVTVFGESAGAESIGALLAMPQSKGLFRKAILQSGASKSQTPETANQTAETLLKALGISRNEIGKLRSVSSENLIRTHTELGMTIGGFGPVRDGKVLKDIPLDAVQRGSARDVLVLAGSNLEEGKLFNLLAGREVLELTEEEMVRRVRQVVPEKYATSITDQYRQALSHRDLPVTPFEIFTAISGDQHFRMPNIRLCEYQEELGMPSYGYVFTWKSAAPDFGACHALDVGFIFGNLNEEFHGCGEEAQELANNMQDAWIAFAKTDDPSCPGLGTWPRYGTDRKMMILGPESHVQTAPYDGERAAWEGIPNSVLG